MEEIDLLIEAVLPYSGLALLFLMYLFYLFDI